MGTQDFKILNERGIYWIPLPEEHDYPAALSYLSLLFDDGAAKEYVRELRRAPIVWFKAKDIFRASQLSFLGISNAHVERDREKIHAGIGLSPILLIKGSPGNPIIIADGYHRLCAVYSYDEDALIPCKLGGVQTKARSR